MTKLQLKYAANLLKAVPEPTYKCICDYLSLNAEDRNILYLRFRNYDYAHTREYVAEEVGISPSTLDRKVKCILNRVCTYCLKCF